LGTCQSVVVIYQFPRGRVAKKKEVTVFHKRGGGKTTAEVTEKDDYAMVTRGVVN